MLIFVLKCVDIYCGLFGVPLSEHAHIPYSFQLVLTTLLVSNGFKLVSRRHNLYIATGNSLLLECVEIQYGKQLQDRFQILNEYEYFVGVTWCQVGVKKATSLYSSRFVVVF